MKKEKNMDTKMTCTKVLIREKEIQNITCFDISASLPIELSKNQKKLATPSRTVLDEKIIHHDED